MSETAKLIIYLDMDGVCVDFFGGIKPLIGIPDDWLPDRYDVPKIYEILDSLGHDFWVNLKPYPYFVELYKMLIRYGHVIFCTSPSNNPGSSSGKHQWLQDVFDRKNFREFVICPTDKHILARGNAVLIDDREDAIDAWEATGAPAFLFPQFWNRNRDKVENRMGLLEAYLETALEDVDGN